MPLGGQLKAAGRSSKAIRELNGMIYERSFVQHSHRNGLGFIPPICLSADRKTLKTHSFLITFFIKKAH